MKNNQKIISNLGAVAGLTAVCILLSIFIPFPVKALETQPCLSISKLGRNISENTSWSETTNAKPSQTAGFSIIVTAKENVVIKNVSVDDVLPAKLEYISGSTKINGVSASDGITNTGIDIGGFSSNQSKTISFEAKIADASQFSTGQTNLTNTAGAWAVCAAKVFDTAKIIVNKEEPSFPSLIISKSVDKTQASPNDEIIYTLNYQNIGGAAATGVVIKDIFDYTNQQYLTFVSATPSPSSGNNTWNIGTLNPGQSGTITIKARISDSLPNNNIEIQNRANISGSEVTMQYSNYVSTWVYFSTNVGLEIQKTVRNYSTGSGFSDSITVNPGAEVEFSLEISSTGNSQVSNVKVWDNLPGRLSYVSGSTKVDGSYYSDGIVSGGININSIGANDNKVVKFRARIDSENMFNVGTTALTNYGYTSADNVGSIYDSAVINVRKESGCSPSLSINKMIRNITQGYGSWTDSVYANPNDEIEVLIKINSIGSETAYNVRVKDQLPSKLNYVSGSTLVGGSSKGDEITYSNGLSLGSLYVGDYREIKFKVRVASEDNFSINTTTTLNNSAYAWSDKVCDEISDAAEVRVTRGGGITPTYAISISKMVRNISRGGTTWLDSVVASPSEELEFSIQVINIGNTDLTNVKTWDVLPANLSIIINSTTIDGVSWGGDVTGAGLNLGTLSQAQTRIVKFRAMIAASTSFGAGSTTLINTAYTNANNVSQISDQASVVVTKPGEVKGAEYVPTGANIIGLEILAITSIFIAVFVYCRLREEKLLDILNSNKSNKLIKIFIKFYFRLRFFFTIKSLRFRQIY